MRTDQGGAREARARRGRDRRAASVLVGGVALLGGAALGVRALGAPSDAAGAGLAVACAALLSGFVALRLRRAGATTVGAGAWGVALLIAMGAPVLRAVFPGKLAGEGILAQIGDAIRVPEGVKGRVRILASGELPERSWLQFSLKAGEDVVGGQLRRGTTWWRAGEDRRHYHEDRRAVVVDGDLRRGVDEIVLVARSGQSVPLTVRVFEPTVQPWFVTVAALLTGLTFAVAWCRRSGTEIIVDVALVGVCSGVLAATAATPDGAVGSMLAGLVGGTLTGVSIGTAFRTVARAVGPRRRQGLRGSRRRGGRMLDQAGGDRGEP